MAGLLLNITVNDQGTVSVQKFNQAVAGAKKPVEDLAASTSRLEGSFSKLGEVASALGVALGIKEIIDLTTEYETLAARVEIVTHSSAEQASVMQQIMRIGQETRTSINELGDGYFKWAQASTDLGMSQDKLLPLLEEFTQLQKIAGVSSEQAARQVGLFSAAIFTGEFNGRAFTAMLRQLPEIGEKVAKAMGVSTQRLAEMASAGMIPAKKAMEAILAIAPELAEEFSKMPVNAEGAGTRLLNSLERIFGEFERGSGIVKTLTDSLNKLSEAMDKTESSKSSGFGAYIASAGRALESGANYFFGSAETIAASGVKAANDVVKALSYGTFWGLDKMPGDKGLDYAQSALMAQAQKDFAAAEYQRNLSAGTPENNIDKLADAHKKNTDETNRDTDASLRLGVALMDIARSSAAWADSTKFDVQLEKVGTAADVAAGKITSLKKEGLDLQAEIKSAQAIATAAEDEFKSQSEAHPATRDKAGNLVDNTDPALLSADKKRIEANHQLELLNGKLTGQYAAQEATLGNQVSLTQRLAAIDQSRLEAESRFALAQDAGGAAQRLTSLNVSGGRITPLQGIQQDAANQNNQLQQQLALEKSLLAAEQSRHQLAVAKINTTEGGDALKLSDEQVASDNKIKEIKDKTKLTEQQIANIKKEQVVALRNEQQLENSALMSAQGEATLALKQNEASLAARQGAANVNAMIANTTDEILSKDDAVAANLKTQLDYEKQILDIKTANAQKTLDEFNAAGKVDKVEKSRLETELDVLHVQQARVPLIQKTELQAAANQKLIDQTKTEVAGATQFVDIMSNGFEAMSQKGANFKTVLAGILVELEKMIFKLLVTDKIKEALTSGIQDGGGIGGLFSGLFGGGATFSQSASGVAASSATNAAFDASLGLAKGAAFDNGDIMRFASGGVVHGATMFNTRTGRGLMGEAGPEAIVPLTRTSGGDLGVKSAPPIVNVQIIDQSDGKKSITQEKSTGADGIQQLKIFIRNETEDNLASGKHNKAMSANFGLQPAGYR